MSGEQYRKDLKQFAIDEQSNFAELRDVVELAFHTHAQKDVAEAVSLIESIEYGPLIEKAEDTLHPLLEVMRDQVMTGEFNDRTWKQTAQTLGALLKAIHETASRDRLQRTVNHIGHILSYQDEHNVIRPLMGTLRDVIEDNDTFRKSAECRKEFQGLFREYGMITHKEWLQKRLRPSTEGPASINFR